MTKNNDILFPIESTPGTDRGGFQRIVSTSFNTLTPVLGEPIVGKQHLELRNGDLTLSLAWGENGSLNIEIDSVNAAHATSFAVPPGYVEMLKGWLANQAR